MLYQKHDIEQFELDKFISNLQLYDFVYNVKDNKISIITELFTNQPPQIDYESYNNIHPIYITENILKSIGFKKVKISSGNGVDYYKFNDKTIYDYYLGIVISNNAYIQIGTYVETDESDNIYFVPMKTIRYLNEIQHIINMLFNNKFHISGDKDFKKFSNKIIKIMKCDNELIAASFEVY